MQATDHNNAVSPGAAPIRRTVEPFTLSTPVFCVATADPAIGGTCEGGFGYIEELGIVLNETGDAPCAELGPLQVWDGGADGDGETVADNTLFAVQGLFVP